MDAAESLCHEFGLYLSMGERRYTEFVARVQALINDGRREEVDRLTKMLVRNLRGEDLLTPAEQQKILDSHMPAISPHPESVPSNTGS